MTWHGARRLMTFGVLALVSLGALLWVADLSRRAPRGPDVALLDSTGPEGLRALGWWLEDLGYEVVNNEYRPFRLTREAGMLVVVNPHDDLIKRDADAILEWVDGGGLLVLASRRQNRVTEILGITVAAQSTVIAVTLPNAEWIPILRSPGRTGVAAATAARGAGRVVVIGDPAPISNAQIGTWLHSAMVLDVLSYLPGGSRVVFDAYHEGRTEHGTLMRRVLTEPWGWAILWLATTVLLFMIFTGRRFGRVQTVPKRTIARAQVEYVTAVAAMLREGNNGAWLRQTYIQQVKSDLGQRFGVPTSLSIPAYATALRSARPGAADLGPALQELEAFHGSWSGMVAQLRRVDDLRARALESD
jgi:hypothetical protein